MLETAEREILGKKLVESGALTTDQFLEAESQARDRGVCVSEYLASSGIVAKSKVFETLAGIYGIAYVEVLNFQIAKEILLTISGELAQRYKAVPLFKIGDSLNVAMVNPLDTAAIDHLSQSAQCSIDVCLAAPDEIEECLKRYYGSASAVSDLLKVLARERSQPKSAGGGKDLKNKPEVTRFSENHSVVQLVDLIMKQAHEEGASDIHVEPEEKMLRIRYRVDGVLREASTAPKQLESEILTRLKILAQMDIAETRIPQDGRIKLVLEGKEADMRVSSVPTVYGENIVIRLLKDSASIPDLPSVGFSPAMFKEFQALIHRPYGMILETGPTGSGKTTTLYAALATINTVDRNIITVEDPVEYKLPMIRQIPINAKAGLTFANALRSILRQDPDVIMVGEIRDRETAEIAIQSALTGHLVFSTLHTNTAAGVFVRLADMKVEPFLIASSVIAAISQRLVRKVCESCRKESQAPEALWSAVNIPESERFKVYKGEGCPSCRFSGYRGRIGIFELLKVTESIQKLVVANRDAATIEEEARKNGFKTLREDALEKVRAGLTTLEEVVKAVNIA